MVKNLPANAGDTRDMGSTSGLGRSPGGGHGNPLQYSGLENPMDTGPGGLQSMWLRQWDTEAASHAHTERHLSVLVFGIKCAFFTHTAKFVI